MAVIWRWLFNSLLLLALVLFVGGLFMPLMELKKLWIFTNTISLLTSLQTLWWQQEYFLFWLLTVFSIITPIMKMTGLALIVNTRQGYQLRHRRFLQALEIWGKWSMLDVFVVALLFVSVKLGSIADITVHKGLYLFAGSVVLVQLLNVWLYLHSRRVQKSYRQ